MLHSLFRRRYLFHLLFWCMYAVFMILEMQGYAKNKGLLFCATPLLIYFVLMAILVYGNTLVLIPSLLQKKRTALYLAAIFVLMLFYTYARSLNQQYWDAIVWPEDRMSVHDYTKWNSLYAIWFTIISSMLFFTQKWYDQRQQVKNIQISQLQTELKYLRSQVNPHFLFNGLNTVYGHIDSSNQTARNILLQFADLLRYNLYEADVDLGDAGKGNHLPGKLCGAAACPQQQQYDHRARHYHTGLFFESCAAALYSFRGKCLQVQHAG
ncbi:MAG: histidine kinase [Chitinophagaceae bacterium]